MKRSGMKKVLEDLQRLRKSPASKTIQGGLHFLGMNLKNWKRRRGSYTDFPPPDTTQILILVPGWLGPGICMDRLAERFSEKGFSVCTYHVGFASCGTLQTMLLGFKQFLHELERACPNLTHINFVAHSLGGILCWDAIMAGLLDGKCVRLVTLATMHRGTPAALWGCPFSLTAWQLLPFRSRFNMRPFYGRMQCVPFLSIAGTGDVIVPPDYAWHVMSYQKIVKADHGKLLVHPDAFRAALNFLSSAHNRPVESLEDIWGPYR